MPTPHHRGVGVIVTNATRERFFVQRKDAHYVPQPRGFSLFGGACEPGESLEAALARELEEELGADIARRLLATGPRACWSGTLGPERFAFALFEIVVDDATLDHLVTTPVFEGECGVVLTREELRGCPFIWELGVVVAHYLRAPP